MTSKHWQEIEQLYHAALEREPNQRAGFLDTSCAGDEELRREVESLIRSHEQAENFIAEPVLKVAAQEFAENRAQSVVGRQIGSYQILSLLGAGGMGEVYLAQDSRLGRKAALKLLPADFSKDEDRVRRFEREARAASALNHPNIITIYEMGQCEGRDFLAMEYLNGKTLNQLIPRKGLPLNQALKYAIQIAEGLAKAHAVGIIHRDLKPSNLMVSEDGLLKVLDFGLAKQVEKTESSQSETMPNIQADRGPQTEEGVILGTVSYMSPEQAEGKKLDARSDIFSFGSVLYEMVTGRRAFQGESNLATLSAILNEQPTPVSEVVPDIPRELEKTITRCLRKDPDRRVQHMDDVKLALQELMEERESDRLAPMAQKGQRRRRSLVWATLPVAVLVIAAAVWLLSRKKESPEAPMTTVPLTSYPGVERFPSFSPDGNQVAFAWDGERQDNFDIYVKLIGPGRPLRLTTHPAPDFSPAWSPDGRLIAFLRELPAGKAGFFLIPALGGPERKLAETYFQLSGFNTPRPYVAWSPDSRWLIIPERNSPGEPFGLRLLSIETGERRKLTSPPIKSLGDSAPALSWDGHALVFARIAGLDVFDLYLLPISGDLTPQGEPKRLTFDNTWTDNPVWTSDGRDIIFISFREAGTGVGYTLFPWRIAASGSDKPHRLAAIGEAAIGLAISRQGRRLVYTRSNWDANIWRVALADQHGKRSPPNNFISSTHSEWNPQYSPDGGRISFLSRRSGSLELWVCNSDGRDAVQLTSFGRQITGHPRWSPDGERIVFISVLEGKINIYVIDANGGKPQRLTGDSADITSPEWSRDGQWIYFAKRRGGQFETWKMPANGGEAALVTQQGGEVTVESPDGKFFYQARNRNPSSLWKVPVAGGEESLVLNSLSYPQNFVVMDQGIYFISGLGDDLIYINASIQFYNFASGKIQLIAKLEKPAHVGLTVSPDRRWILYTQHDEAGSDLMLVENFR